MDLCLTWELFSRDYLWQGKSKPGRRIVGSLMPISHHRHRQDKIVLSCPCQWCELNWRQVKTVFSRPEYIWDWTVANWKLSRDKTKLKLETVLSCRQFSSHRWHGQDSFVLSVSAVWNRHCNNVFHHWSWQTVFCLLCICDGSFHVWP